MIIALAGRRVDPLGAETPRFSLDQVGVVRNRLRSLFQSVGATTLVASGACGADLLAMQAAGELGLRRRMVIPFDPPVFREKSVVDRPGEWGPIFDQIASELAAAGDLIVLGEPGDSDAAYARTNAAMIAEAVRLAREIGREPNLGILVVVVWDGQPRDSTDLTADFASKARALGLAVREVSTRADAP